MPRLCTHVCAEQHLPTTLHHAYNVVQGPEATQLVESCQRNCLLALSLVYVPMPGMPRSNRSVNCSWCCLPQSNGFAGHAKDLISGESAMATRSLVTGSPDPSAVPPVFALTNVLHGEAVHAVFSHVHTPDETRLALNTIELLLSVSSYDEPQDMDMVWPLLVLNCSIKNPLLDAATMQGYFYGPSAISICPICC